MVNPLNELSAVYSFEISEESPDEVKSKVSQYAKAIRYRARKTGVPVSKAYNDFMGSQSGVSATEKQMVKQRLGLTGGGVSESTNVHGNVENPSKDLKSLVKKASKRVDADVDGDIDKDDSKEGEMGEFVPSPDGKKKLKPKVQKEGYSNWRHDLTEVMDDAESETSKKVDVMKGSKKNKIKINPVMGEEIKKLGGTILEVTEIEEAEMSPEEKKTLSNKEQMLKKQQMLDRQRLQMQKQGKLPTSRMESADEGMSVFDKVKARLEKQHGKGTIVGAPKKKVDHRKSNTAKAHVRKPTEREKESSGRYTGGYAGD